MKNLSDVLNRRWFRYDRFDIAFFAEDITGHLTGQIRFGTHTAPQKLAVSTALSLFDVLMASATEDALRLEYQLRDHTLHLHSGDASLGKRAPHRHDGGHQPLHFAGETSAGGRGQTPGAKREQTSQKEEHVAVDDDYLSMFDNPDNTVNLSLLANVKNENSMISAIIGPSAFNLDPERSNFLDAVSEVDRARRHNGAKKSVTRTNTVLQLNGPDGDRGELRTTFIFCKKERERDEEFVSTLRSKMHKLSKESSVKLEATPSVSAGHSPEKSTMTVREEKKQQLSTSEHGFDLEVQLFKERLSKVDKEKNSQTQSVKTATQK